MGSGKLVGSLRWLLAAACAAALLSGCAPTAEEVLAANRPAVDAVFARIKALDATVRDAPPVVEDRIDAGSARVVLDGDDSNALFIRAESLAAPEMASSDGNGGTHSITVKTCGEALRGDFGGVPEGMQSFLSECGRAEYLFVLRTREDVAAEIVGERTFRPGKYEGDVLLYRLADGALLGGFGIAAESSDEVNVLTDAAGVPQDAMDRLNSDINSSVFVGIQEKIRKLVPGAIP